jgi:hypothetical protein
MNMINGGTYSRIEVIWKLQLNYLQVCSPLNVLGCNARTVHMICPFVKLSMETSLLLAADLWNEDYGLSVALDIEKI